MNRLNFNTYIDYTKETGTGFGIANPKNIEEVKLDEIDPKTGKPRVILQDEQYLVKFYLKQDSSSKKNKLFYQSYKTGDRRDYKKIVFREEGEKIVKSQIESRAAKQQRVKNFLHFGTYGFVTFDNAGTTVAPSVLLIHMMNEKTTTENPNYNLNIGIKPTFPPALVVPSLPIPPTPLEFIVIDDVYVFDRVDDVITVETSVAEIEDKDLIVFDDTHTLSYEEIIIVDDELYYC